MALIKCTECGKEVSENATSCPNCGNPINQGVRQTKTSGSRKTGVKKLLWGIGIAALVFVIYIFTVVAPSQQLTPEKAHELLEETGQNHKEKLEKDKENAREYIRIIQSDNATMIEKSKAYNELIKNYESFSVFSIEEIERMK